MGSWSRRLEAGRRFCGGQDEGVSGPSLNPLVSFIVASRCFVVSVALVSPAPIPPKMPSPRRNTCLSFLTPEKTFTPHGVPIGGHRDYRGGRDGTPRGHVWGPEGFSEGAALFDIHGHNLRVIEIDSAPWFVAADVSKALGLTSQAQVKAVLNLTSIEVQDFRVAQIDNAPWFVAADIANSLGLTSTAQVKATSNMSSIHIRDYRVAQIDNAP